MLETARRYASSTDPQPDRAVRLQVVIRRAVLGAAVPTVGAREART